MSLRRLASTITRRVFLTLVIVAALGAFTAASHGQTDKASSDRRRDEEVKSLIAILRDKEVREMEPERLKNAIMRLGELKAVEATEDLAALLDSRWPRELVHGGSHEGDRYWAKEALFEIGKPALPALVKEIEMTDPGSLLSKNACDTVMLIFREDRVQGPAYLRDAAKKASSSLASQRLNTAAAYIEAINAKLPPQSPKPKSQ